MVRTRLAVDRLIALAMSPWLWLTPRARLYKAATWAVAVLLGLAMLDKAFVLPEVDGWLGVFSLAGALAITVWAIWRWASDELLDVPREWLAPVRPR